MAKKRSGKRKQSPCKLHDSFFHEMMTERNVQLEFLQAYLPERLLQNLDWDKVRLAPEHFVTGEWAQRNSDMLFELSYQDRPAYFYVLLEHQSKPDPVMPLRLLEYQVQIWRRHLKTHRGKRLPYIHSMIFYTGKEPYRFNFSIKEMIDGPAELIRVLWDQPFELIDLKLQDFQDLSRYVHLSAMLAGFRTQFVPLLDELVQVLSQVHQALPDSEERLIFGKLLTYLFHLRDDLEPEQLAKEADNQELGELRSEIMSVAHRLIEKGRVEGLNEGLNKGRVEGLNEGLSKGHLEKEQEIAKKLFRKGQTVQEIAAFLELEPARVQRYLIAEAPSN